MGLLLLSRLPPSLLVLLRWGLAAALLGTATGAPAQGWVLTMLDGEATLLDGTRRFAAAVGARPGAGAIVESHERTALLRLEVPGQGTVDLGPSTRVMLAPPGLAPRAGRAPQLYVLEGWVKVTSLGKAGTPGVVLGASEIGPFDGSVVLQATRREFAAFVEAGRIDTYERHGSTPVAAEAGNFVSGEAGRRAAVSPRPPHGWLATVPRAFRDPVPLRAEALKDRRVELRPLPDLPYDKLAEWLLADPDLRRPLAQRFAPRLAEPEFRRAALARLSSHPEWRPILDPPKPRPPAPPAAAPEPPAAAAAERPSR